MKPFKRQGGSILLEGVVAMLIAAIGSVGVLKLQSALISNAAEAKIRSEATSLAEAKIDDLRDTMLSTEHFGTSCVLGTRMVNDSDTANGSSNATYARSWSVTPYCNPTRHMVSVTVSWGTETGKSVTLSSVIAWNDPAKEATTTGSGGAGGAGFGTPTTARLVSEPPIATLPEGSTERGDGTAISFNAAEQEYSLYAKVPTGYQRVLISSVELVALSGLIGIEPASGFSVDMTKIRIVGSEAVYCTQPLRFGDQDDPSTYGVNNGVLSSSSDGAGAYVCYVPTGWTGSLALFERNGNVSCGFQLFADNKDGNCKFTEALACPEMSVGTIRISGERSVKSLVFDNGQIVGQSGVLPVHGTMAIPGYTNLTRTQRLDYAIYKPASGSTPQRCASIFSTPGSGGLTGFVNGANYSIFLRNGAGTNSSINYGVPSIRFPDYVIDAYGFATVTGSVGQCSAPLNATGTGSFSGKNYICTISTSTYSCRVDVGWTGTIGSISGSTTVSTPVPLTGTTLNICP